MFVDMPTHEIAPERLDTGEWPLHAAERTPKDRRHHAYTGLFLYGLAAIVVSKTLTALLEFAIGENVFTQAIDFIVIPAGGLWGFLKHRLGPGLIWTSREWIDFGNRTWNKRKHYTDESKPVELKTLPLDALAVVCHAHKNDEDGCVSYSCHLSELEYIAVHRWVIDLRTLKRFDSEDACLAFTRVAAAHCAISGWLYHNDTLEGGTARLEKLA
ncbi:hypothetical protein INH39_26385 [Massilia violaceinigra]|uniref:SMODS-associating 2TM beta-strand rich effector domain-containing protein n=1 Tax=Massilia violaceinigra TaxID=2045208 RepID=A0ABY4A5U6_9BURK|nr:hypothetical protein [Massilia violaceinigra]UOD28931.1 hypothetical protein INH39_26385 [Massilia violaceinigra]